MYQYAARATHGLQFQPRYWLVFEGLPGFPQALQANMATTVFSPSKSFPMFCWSRSYDSMIYGSVVDIAGGKEAEGVWEHGVEENICT